jgi:nucleoid-associated protein YgaU
VLVQDLVDGRDDDLGGAVDGPGHRAGGIAELAGDLRRGQPGEYLRVVLGAGQDSSLTKTIAGLPPTVSGEPAPLTFCSGVITWPGLTWVSTAAGTVVTCRATAATDGVACSLDDRAVARGDIAEPGRTSSPG